MGEPSSGRPAPADRVRVLGHGVDAVTLNQAAARVARWLEGRDDSGGASAPTPARLVVTANPEILWSARQDAVLRAVLAGADLVVADGIGVVWAARRCGRPLPQRVPGVELMERLLAESARRGWRPFFLGTRADVVARAAAAAQRRFPGLKVAGWHHGYFPRDTEAAVLQAIHGSGADLLFAGMGAERELKWLHAHRHRLGVGVAMGVGGSLDVLAGAVARAPAWVRRVHLEWLYRLVRQPGRWRRQLLLPRFVLAVLAESRGRWGAGP